MIPTANGLLIPDENDINNAGRAALPIYDVLPENFSTDPMVLDNHLTASIARKNLSIGLTDKNLSTAIASTRRHPTESSSTDNYSTDSFSKKLYSADRVPQRTDTYAIDTTDSVSAFQVQLKIDSNQNSTEYTSTLSQDMTENTMSTDEMHTSIQIPLTIAEEMIRVDTETIAQQFNPFVSISFQPIFEEHHQRARAFLTCCELTDSSDRVLLKRFVDAYGLLDEQTEIIQECVDQLINSTKMACDLDLRKLDKARHLTKRFTDLYSENDSRDSNIAMQLLDQAISQTIDVTNVVDNYDNEIYGKCDSAIILLWKPSQLVDCEIYYRSLFVDYSLGQERYDKYNKEISLPFQQKTLSLLVPVKNAWNKVADQVKKNIQEKFDNKPVPEDQLEKDINHIRNTLTYYIIKLDHPMVNHYAHSAHVFKVCCTSIKTSDIFNEYLAFFDHDPNQGHHMDKFLHSCVQHQAFDPVDVMKENNECNVSYNRYLDALQKRQDFIDKYEKLNPQMVIWFREAIRLKIGQSDIIRTMTDYVDKYCQSKHVFELMFDACKTIDCEKMIRHAIGKESSKTYSYYNISVSYSFQNMILEDWDNLARTITHLDTNDENPTATMIQELQASLSVRSSRTNLK
ncbi:unnamed protein product [Rotaria socialis]|uniref:Uncharacterized protein n=1 Tax=Rotaria socialis TaxID=392032 RepID=A0A818CMK3_9BILA|nr:unnamed protein product [Rotaria socialis]CAF3432332.1 unnamed protein product [Rotaria socialis]CAF4358708.1 unnamed protein product [Rotaria socialis]CAF4423475.1 unnamed protein product [Rotaria socialis]